IIASYPATLQLVKYTTSSGSFNFNVGSLPPATPAFAGYITNNTASGSLNLVLTNGPRDAQALTWSGQIGNGDWDNFTPNWITNGMLMLSGANSFTGAVTVAAGTLRLNNNSALGSTNGTTTIASGATLDVSGKTLGFELIIAGGIGVPAVGFTNGAIANGNTN